MSKYFVVYLVLTFFAVSLAVADEKGHDSTTVERPKREPAIDSSQREEVIELENVDAKSLIEALETAERGLGKRRSIGEVSEVKDE